MQKTDVLKGQTGLLLCDGLAGQWWGLWSEPADLTACVAVWLPGQITWPAGSCTMLSSSSDEALQCKAFALSPEGW